MDAYQRSASSEVTFDNVVYTTVVFEDSSSMIEILTDAPEGYHADNYIDNAAHQQRASNAGDIGGQHADPYQRDSACGLSDETRRSIRASLEKEYQAKFARYKRTLEGRFASAQRKCTELEDELRATAERCSELYALNDQRWDELRDQNARHERDMRDAKRRHDYSLREANRQHQDDLRDTTRHYERELRAKDAEIQAKRAQIRRLMRLDTPESG